MLTSFTIQPLSSNLNAISNSPLWAAAPDAIHWSPGCTQIPCPTARCGFFSSLFPADRITDGFDAFQRWHWPISTTLANFSHQQGVLPDHPSRFFRTLNKKIWLLQPFLKAHCSQLWCKRRRHFAVTIPAMHTSIYPGCLQTHGMRLMDMATFINKIYRLWTKGREPFLGVFLAPTLKKGLSNLRHARYFNFSSKTIIPIFQWIPSLLVNPGSLLWITIAGSISFMIPLLKKAWHLIQMG
jgi:hypothetical protein